MSKIITLFESNTFATLLGVLIGFALSFVWEWVKDRKRRKQIKINLVKELESIQGQIKEKKRAIVDVQNALDKGSFLDPKTTHVNCMVYTNSIGEIYSEMDVLSLNCLHLIYERIRLAEDILDTFKDDFITHSNSRDRDAFSIGKVILKDVMESYDKTIKLVDSFLKGEPIDVHYIKEQ